MSDDDDFMQDSDQEEWEACATSNHNHSKCWRSSSYDFEYEDEDEDQGGDVDIENKYYNAKQMKVDNPEEAIGEFLGVPALEGEKGDWWVLVSQTCNGHQRLTQAAIQGIQRP
jgi:COP9 signalosome complex subunit 2